MPENITGTGAELPPQAQTGLPALAAEYAPVQQAPTAGEALTESMFGTQGAQNYTNLQAANRQVPAQPAVMNSGSAVPSAQGLSDLLSSALIGSATRDPLAGQRMFLQHQKAAAAQQAAQQVAAVADMAFYKNLKDNIAIGHRAQFAADYFAKQGRPVPPSILQALSDQSILEKMSSEDIQNRLATDPKFMSMYINAVHDPEKFTEFLDNIKKSKAQAEEAQSKADIALQKSTAGPSLKDLPKKPEELAASQAAKEGYSAGTKEYSERVADLTAAYKTPPATTQRAISEVQRARDTATELKTMLDDPMFKDAKTRLGPSATTNVMGMAVGIPKFNVAWRNYREFGGEGNDEKTNRLMEAIGFYQGTGFQGFLNGIRNPTVIDDIRVHIPQPYDEEATIRSKIDYLEGRYGDALAAYTTAGKPPSAVGTSTTPPPSTSTPPSSASRGGTISAADFLNQ